MICKKCGENNKKGFRFCQKCGIPLEEKAGASDGDNNTGAGVRRKKSYVGIIAAVVVVVLLGTFFAYTKLTGKSGGNNLYPIKIEKSWGYMNKVGDIIISPQYDLAAPFSDGFARVARIDRNGKYLFGLIDKTGKIVAEIKYLSMRVFKNGLIAVAVGEERSLKWGYMDESGKFAIPPQFTDVTDFHEDLAVVSIGRDKWGFIDKTGKFVVDPSLTDRSVGFFEGHNDPVSQFRNGLAPLANQEGLWGYIDKTGKFAIAPQFSAARMFAEDLAAVAVTTSGTSRKWGYIDKSGKLVVAPRFFNAGDFSEEKAVVSITGSINMNPDNRLFGVINKKGEFVIQPAWPSYQLIQNIYSPEEYRGRFVEGLLATSKQTSARKANNEGLWGFVDINGKTAIEQKFISVANFNDGIARVVLNDGRMAYIDKVGHIILPKQTMNGAASSNPASKEQATINLPRQTETKEKLDGYAQPGERKKASYDIQMRPPAPETLMQDTIERTDFYLLDILDWNLGRKNRVTIKNAIEWFGEPVEKSVNDNPTAKMTTLRWRDLILVLEGAVEADEVGTVAWIQWQAPAKLASYRGIRINDSKNKVIEKYGRNYRSRKSGGLEWVYYTGSRDITSGMKIGFGIDPTSQTVKSIYHGLLPVSVGMTFPQ